MYKFYNKYVGMVIILALFLIVLMVDVVIPNKSVKNSPINELSKPIQYDIEENKTLTKFFSIDYEQIGYQELENEQILFSCDSIDKDYFKLYMIKERD